MLSIFKALFLSSWLISSPGHAQAPASGNPQARPRVSDQKIRAMLHKLDKSIILSNKSKKDWHLSLLSPAADQLKTPGVLEVYVPDFARAVLTRAPDARVDEDILIAPGQTLVISPVPAKSVGATLGLTQRPDFKRVIALKDAGKKAILMGVFRNGSGRKVPQLLFVDKEVERRVLGRVFTLEEDEGADATFLTIIKDEVGAL